MTSRAHFILQMAQMCNVEKKEKNKAEVVDTRTNVMKPNSSQKPKNNIDIVQEWLNSNDFQSLAVPQPTKVPIENDLNDGNNRVFTNLMPLNVENNVSYPEQTNLVKNMNDLPEAVSNFGETIDLNRPPSESINIISNIVLKMPTTEDCFKINSCDEQISSIGSIVSESVCDDPNDKDFNVCDGEDEGFENSTTDEENDEVLCNSGLKVSEVGTLICNNKKNIVSVSEYIKEKRNRNKNVARCKFCDEDTISKNFLRHLQRHHGSEPEIIKILEYPKNSKERREALSLLRNSTNFDLYIAGTVRPNRKNIAEFETDNIYYPCAYCKGLFLKNYLKRHAKICISRRSIPISNRTDYLSKSHTVTACASDPTETLSKLNVKEQVFDNMKGDKVSFEAKNDLLIAYFGESYLKRHKRERMTYVCSNRMRELARLLIRYREIVNNQQITFKELLHPKNFDAVILATRDIVGYDPFKKTFKAPSLGMHLGTSLKIACDELVHLVLKESKGFKCSSQTQTESWIKNIKHFKKLIESRWNIEIASLATKDLQEKRWNKPLLLPLVSDIQRFRDGCLEIGNDCDKKLCENGNDIKSYTLLVQCTLSLLIIFNRRRIGDVQFLKIAHYRDDKKSNLTDFQSVLTDTEKMLTTKYKRVVNTGKGSRAVVILIPEILQKFVNILLKHRRKFISDDNEYIFAIPGSKIQWGKGDVAIRMLAKKINLKYPHNFTSNKLRKHIATVMQLLNLTPDEAKQFSSFMGHSEKTHKEFYELPIDIYQTAKISKLLLLMEKGTLPLQYKGKSLGEIDFNSNLEYAVESDNDEGGVTTVEESFHEPCVAKPINNSRDKNIALNLLSSTETDVDQISCTVEKDLNMESDVINVKNDNDEEIVHEKKCIKKRKWTNNEINALEKEFSTCVKKKIYPSGDDIKRFLKENKINRTIPMVKAKLQHLMK